MTIEEINEIFADNATGSITAEDLRSFAVSTKSESTQTNIRIDDLIEWINNLANETIASFNDISLRTSKEVFLADEDQEEFQMTLPDDLFINNDVNDANDISIRVYKNRLIQLDSDYNFEIILANDNDNDNDESDNILKITTNKCNENDEIYIEINYIYRKDIKLVN